MSDKINLLKIEIFDIIRNQESLNNQFNKLQQLKLQKLEELQKLESSL